MTGRFDDVQEAARKRATSTINSEAWAKQIVASAQGDARMAYDFLDMLNRHVTDILQGRK
jgi:replication-associated recombination protein RarA